MTDKKEPRCTDEKGNEIQLPDHLRDDATYFRCSKCGRKTWSKVGPSEQCGMPQPNGQVCDGVWTR